MRYRLRTLWISTMVGPPFVAVAWVALRGEDVNPVLFSAVMWIIIIFALCWLYY